MDDVASDFTHQNANLDFISWLCSIKCISVFVIHKKSNTVAIFCCILLQLAVFCLFFYLYILCVLGVFFLYKQFAVVHILPRQTSIYISIQVKPMLLEARHFISL